MADEQWTESDARRILEEARRSGQTFAQFAREKGLTPARLYWWKKRLTCEAEPMLLPVRITGAQDRGEPITVLLRSGHVLKVARGFDEDAFTRVVALLEVG